MRLQISHATVLQFKILPTTRYASRKIASSRKYGPDILRLVSRKEDVKSLIKINNAEYCAIGF